MATRRRTVAVVLATAGVVGLLATACGTVESDAAARQVSGSVVSDAAGRTADVTSGRSVVTTTFEGFSGGLAPADGSEVRVDGTFDVSTGRATMSVDLTQVAEALGGGLGRFGAALLPGLFDEPSTAVVDGETIYVRSPLVGLVGSPTPWVSAPVSGSEGEVAAGGFADPLELDRLDRARGFVTYLEGVADQVQQRGSEDIEGVTTTRYEGTIDLDRLVAQLPAEEQARARNGLAELTVGEIPFVVWIDGGGLVRRVQLRLDDVTLGSDAGGTGRGTVVVSADLLDPNQPITIDVPSAGEVTPVDSLRGGGLGDSSLLPRLGN